MNFMLLVLIKDIYLYLLPRSLLLVSILNYLVNMIDSIRLLKNINFSDMYGCSYRVSDLLSSQNCYFRILTSFSSPAAQLQINLGEAHVIRNAGGCAYVGLYFQIVSYSSTVTARRHLGAS